MLQHSQITIHKPLHTVLYTAFLFTRKLACRYRSGYAFLEAGLGEFVYGCKMSVLIRYKHH